ncbi:MAG: hypothetical protein U0610_24775 [bacterium]
MSLARRFDTAAFRRVYAAPTFSPTDCPNFLTYADLAQYRWYARLLAPVLLATGGGPLFVGHRVATWRDQSPCETWMLVRYRNHRRMLAMIANPYYAFVNRFRERGTARLELAFTEPRDPKSGVETHRRVLAAHVCAADPTAFFDAIRNASGRAGLPVVYESVVRLDFEFVVDPRPNDPNRLTYPVTAAVGGSDEATLRAFAESANLAAALDRCERACVQLYRRGSTRELLGFATIRPPA